MNFIIRNIYTDILEISDINKQKDLWLGKNPHYSSSYTEVMCRLFDDNNFDLFIDKLAIEFGISKEIVEELNKLRILLNNYVEKEHDVDIIEDPKWLLIVDQAKKIIKRWDIK